jgi:hypothetical protein
MTLNFDLFLIKSWRGDDGVGVDDLFGVQVTTGIPGGLSLLNDTFSNWATFSQSYPGTLGVDHFPGRTGAAENNTLGYQITGTGGDSVYNFSFAFSHSTPTLDITFFCNGCDPPGNTDTNSGWGLDNVSVSVSTTPIPEPSSMLLFGAGLAGLAAWRYRKGMKV